MRLLGAATILAAVPAVQAIITPGSAVQHVALCPQGMVPNPAGYGCVPDLVGGAPVGAPSQDVLTRCHGNYYICVWPYSVP